MTRYVVANWKSHKKMQEAQQWMTDFCRFYRPDPKTKVIIAPPVVYLELLNRMLRELKATELSLAVQDLSPFPFGSYSGAVAAEMVQDLVDFTILGHSERRRYFHETDQEIANKVSEAVNANIRPILCVDRPYAASQLAALDDAVLADLIIGYGPVEAIGIDIPQSPEAARQGIDEIRNSAPDSPVLYGGSVNASNAGDYMRISGVSGLMVGSASLDPHEFAAICRAVAAA